MVPQWKQIQIITRHKTSCEAIKAALLSCCTGGEIVLLITLCEMPTGLLQLVF